MRHLSANSATGAACRQTAMWRLWKWTDFSQSSRTCFFLTGPPGLDRREIVGKRPLLLSNFLAAGGESTGSELPSPQMMETGVSEFFETTPPRSNLDRPDRGDVQDQWYAGGCADPGHVRSLSPTSGTQTYEFLGTDGGWSPKLCDTFVPSGWYSEKQNWRGGRHDQSRLKTMSMGGSGVREASAMTATRKSFAQPELRRIRVVVPPSRRESAGGYGAISRTPLQSFGGESRKPANFGIRTRNAGDGNQPSLCAATRKADVSIKVGQSSLHWSRHIASTATPALGIASWSRLSDIASIAPSFVIDLFSANTDLQQFFLNGGAQCAKLEPFSDDNTIFRREFKRFCASWHVVGPSPPPASSLSVARNYRPVRSATQPWALPDFKMV